MEPTNTEQDQFELHFKRPETVEGLSGPVNLSIALGAMASRLALEERTRVTHPDGRRENVAEHALMLVKVATYIAKEFYDGVLDAGKVAIKAASHDDVEAYVLDTATDRISDEQRLIKDKKEQFGLKVLEQEYSSVAPTYVHDVATYEQLESPEDEFVKIIDKWMVLLIHLPNNGDELKANYTYEEYIRRTYDEEARLKSKFHRFPELIAGRTELALYIGRKVYADIE